MPSLPGGRWPPPCPSHCRPGLSSLQPANPPEPGGLRRPQRALGEEDPPEAGPLREGPAPLTVAVAPGAPSSCTTAAPQPDPLSVTPVSVPPLSPALTPPPQPLPHSSAQSHPGSEPFPAPQGPRLRSEGPGVVPGPLHLHRRIPVPAPSHFPSCTRDSKATPVTSLLPGLGLCCSLTQND